MNHIKLCAALAAVILSGCAANTGFVQLTEDTYMYGKQDMWAYSGSAVKADMYKEAIAFCVAKGKKFSPGASSATDAAVYQSHAGAEIQFRCL
jgi:hypothetical protein